MKQHEFRDLRERVAFFIGNLQDATRQYVNHRDCRYVRWQPDELRDVLRTNAEKQIDDLQYHERLLARIIASAKQLGRQESSTYFRDARQRLHETRDAFLDIRLKDLHNGFPAGSKEIIALREWGVLNKLRDQATRYCDEYRGLLDRAERSAEALHDTRFDELADLFEEAWVPCYTLCGQLTFQAAQLCVDTEYFVKLRNDLHEARKAMDDLKEEYCEFVDVLPEYPTNWGSM